MPLTVDAALDAFEMVHQAREAERDRLDRIRKYLRDDPVSSGPFTATTTISNAPAEVRQLARISRVNVCKFVVNTRVQSMFVDGFRARRASDDAPAWEAWQANGMDARQIGVHRAGLAYGASYVVVLPGEPTAVIRGRSPRQMTAVYGDDDVWPVYAIEPRAGSGRWRLYDRDAIYEIARPKQGRPELVGVFEHGAEWAGEPVTPVVRFRDTDDLDDPVTGIVEPFIPLQDQINITTFGLHVAQHYGAFRQRYILGWLAESEEQKLKASASKLWTFEDDDITIGEFDQTDLSGYIESREATLRHLATVSQTPAHELIGQLVNLSAEALAAAEASKRRAITENQEVMGESWEQTLGLVSALQGVEVDPQAYVRWRDTESRSLSMVVDALGKAVTMLGIPPQELWERVADAMGVSQQELESWKAAAAEGDAFANLEGLLALQSEPADGAV